MTLGAPQRANLQCDGRSPVQGHLQRGARAIDQLSAGTSAGKRDASNGWAREDFQEEHGTMEHTRPMGSLIGFDADAVSSRAAINHGRRATDRPQAFAEIFDLAAYANSGSKDAARVAQATPAPLADATPVACRPLIVPPPTACTCT